MKVKLSDVKFHEYAELTPPMTEGQYVSLAKDISKFGQKEPIKIANDRSGKCFDGRHRVKALIENGEEFVDAIIIDEAVTDEDIKQLVLSSEHRRHQSTTQKVIMAFREQKKLRAKGEKVTDGEMAESFGFSRKWLGTIRDIERLAGSDIIDILFDGGKIELPNKLGQMYLTDSLGAIQSHYKNRNQDIAARSKLIEERTSLEPGEVENANEDFEILTAKYNSYQIKYLVAMLKEYIK